MMTTATTTTQGRSMIFFFRSRGCSNRTELRDRALDHATQSRSVVAERKKISDVELA
jgi:hypothetical protein